MSTASNKIPANTRIFVCSATRLDMVSHHESLCRSDNCDAYGTDKTGESPKSQRSSGALRDIPDIADMNATMSFS